MPGKSHHRPAWVFSTLIVASVAACSDAGETPKGGNSRGGAAGASAGSAGAGGAVGSDGGGAAGNSGASGASGGAAGDAGSGASSGSGGTGGGPTCTAGAGGVPDLPSVNGSCTPGQNTIDFETAEFCVSLTRASQTVAALKPKAASSFDFTPADQLSARSRAGYMHLGDLNLRVRTGTGVWQNVSTSSSRTAVTALQASGAVQAAADLKPALPATLPLTVTRSWIVEGGRLVMRVELKNASSSPVEVGALGFPMIFNNVITGRSLDQAHATCSFADPYIGQDAGYLQVTRLSGQAPALLVLPERGTPFEAFNPILNAVGGAAIFTDPTPRQQTFEGFHEWMVHTSAYASNEWGSVQPWNAPSAATLAPGEARTYGLKFVLSDQIRNIEAVLAKNQRPVAVGIPGYILPTDVQAKLFLNYPAAITSVTVEPAGAISITEGSPTANCWKAYTLQGKTWGRARVTVNYADATVQTVHYTVIKPATQTVSDLGSFLTSKAWFVDANDPFGRSPSVMTYDKEDDKIVTQTKQAWVCGLGDDGGATWLAGAMKLFGQPAQDQVSKYQQFVDGVIWGGLQYSSGSLMYGVKRTLFYYEPNELPAGYYDRNIDWTYWGAWRRAHTEEVPRSYNYPHVAALYWTLYRLARNQQGLVTNHPWDWYLDHAYRTSVAMTTVGNGYARFGLMDGSVFLEILKDLKREGMTAQASDLETRMKSRADVWRRQAYPFGSEMAWDSTGQEEVYAWTKYFGDAAKSKVCLDAILGYMPTVPHWGYNGSARRYWDFIYGGAKIDRLERMLHHYGSSLNAIPVLSEYRDHPDDLYLLRVGYGGMMGSLSNIDQQGFPSMAFHSFADTMKWDARTGDYGLNFFGHAFSSATYLVNHPEFGWQAFGGNVTRSNNLVRVTPLDSFRKRLYLASLGLWLTLDAGQFQEAELNVDTGALRVALAPSDSHTPSARLRVEQPAQVAGAGSYTVTGSYTKERDAFVVPLAAAASWVELSD